MDIVSASSSAKSLAANAALSMNLSAIAGSSRCPEELKQGKYQNFSIKVNPYIS